MRPQCICTVPLPTAAHASAVHAPPPAAVRAPTGSQDEVIVLADRGYYSRHPKGRNPVAPRPHPPAPLLFTQHKRLPLREGAESYGMCCQGFSIMTCPQIHTHSHFCASVRCAFRFWLASELLSRLGICNRQLRKTKKTNNPKNKNQIKQRVCGCVCLIPMHSPGMLPCHWM